MGNSTQEQAHSSEQMSVCIGLGDKSVLSSPNRSCYPKGRSTSSGVCTHRAGCTGPCPSGHAEGAKQWRPVSPSTWTRSSTEQDTQCCCFFCLCCKSVCIMNLALSKVNDFSTIGSYKPSAQVFTCKGTHMKTCLFASSLQLAQTQHAGPPIKYFKSYNQRESIVFKMFPRWRGSPAQSDLSSTSGTDPAWCDQRHLQSLWGLTTGTKSTPEPADYCSLYIDLSIPLRPLGN